MNEEHATAGPVQASPPLRKWSWQYPEDFEPPPPLEPLKPPSEFWFRAVLRWVLIWGFMFFPVGWKVVLYPTLAAGLAAFSVAEGVTTFIRTRLILRTTRHFLLAIVLIEVAQLLSHSSPRYFEGYSTYFWIVFPLPLLICWLLDAMDRRFHPDESRRFDAASLAAGRWGRLFMRHIPNLRQPD